MQCFLPVAVHESGVFAVELQQGLHTHVDATAGEAAGRHHPRTAKVKICFFVRNSLTLSIVCETMNKIVPSLFKVLYTLPHG